MEDKSFKNEIFSLRIMSKFTYILLIFSLSFTIFLAVSLNYQNYTYNKGYNILFFLVCLFILGFIYSLFHTIFKTIFSIQLRNEQLIIKKPFNRSIILRYNQISEINISYDKLPVPLRKTPYDDILIERKFNKPIKIMIKKGKIDLRNDSNFMKWTNYLAAKTSVNIQIHTIYRKIFAKDAIETDARLIWSDNPNVYKKMK
ncbi:hypothetical protein Fleli_2633 [Bernardetia litoralis DSM 6794]|uniref:Uncharacterized protein n=1 Tax=Bernardetia litoralis (strain ATCC 23117 / DSM 6794 / NBRC 15988 / NCIMB 1366 / Fx l1 / Sio-4) TaxID=880071 RepID=I4AM09_BERLS|nr:hypothetical protein [Bernardetia litoralis]AFM04994.1 hypothetical protein Fleli_2633 [Bernardetia litoralis DSM 6794]